MKKSLWLCVMISLFACIACGCATQSSTANVENAVESGADNAENLGSQAYDTEEATKLAIKAFNLMRAQKWDEYRALFPKKYHKYLDKDLMHDGWVKIFSPAGAYEGPVVTNAIIQNNLITIEYIVRFKDKVLGSVCTVNPKGKIEAHLFPTIVDSSEWNTCYGDCIYIADRIGEAIRKQDWEFIHKHSTDQLNQALTDEMLTAGMKEIGDIGKYVALESRTAEKKDGSTIVTLKNRHEKAIFEALMSFDQDGKLQGIRIVPPKALVDHYQPVTTDAFAEEVVSVASDPALPLKGLLTLPKNVEKPPVLILVWGSGPHDMNEQVGPNPVFMDLAYSLAQKGIAVLRFNKRTNQHPTAFDSNFTPDDEYMNDVDVAIKMMAADPRVGKVFVLGHSLGGALIPAISVQHPELSGVISMAGTLRKLPLLAIEQLRNQLEVAKVEAPDQYEKFAPQINAQIADWEEAAAITDDTQDDGNIRAGVGINYWKKLYRYINTEMALKVTQPFMIVQGEEDKQVFFDKDYKLWQETVCDRENVMCKAYPGLNHMMMPTQGKKNNEEYVLRGSLLSEFVQDVADFVLKH